MLDEESKLWRVHLDRKGVEERRRQDGAALFGNPWFPSRRPSLLYFPNSPSLSAPQQPPFPLPSHLLALMALTNSLARAPCHACHAPVQVYTKYSRIGARTSLQSGRHHTQESDPFRTDVRYTSSSCAASLPSLVALFFPLHLLIRSACFERGARVRPTPCP